MSVEHIGKGYVKICVSEEELENSIAGLSQLKPILQTQVMKGNGRNTKQGLIDAAELGKHFDTAIDANFNTSHVSINQSPPFFR